MLHIDNVDYVDDVIGAHTLLLACSIELTLISCVGEIFSLRIAQTFSLFIWLL